MCEFATPSLNNCDFYLIGHSNLVTNSRDSVICTSQNEWEHGSCQFSFREVQTIFIMNAPNAHLDKHAMDSFKHAGFGLCDSNRYIKMYLKPLLIDEALRVLDNHLIHCRNAGASNDRSLDMIVITDVRFTSGFDSLTLSDICFGLVCYLPILNDAYSILGYCFPLCNDFVTNSNNLVICANSNKWERCDWQFSHRGVQNTCVINASNIHFGKHVIDNSKRTDFGSCNSNRCIKVYLKPSLTSDIPKVDSDKACNVLNEHLLRFIDVSGHRISLTSTHRDVRPGLAAASHGEVAHPNVWAFSDARVCTRSYARSRTHTHTHARTHVLPLLPFLLLSCFRSPVAVVQYLTYGCYCSLPSWLRFVCLSVLRRPRVALVQCHAYGVLPPPCWLRGVSFSVVLCLPVALARLHVDGSACALACCPRSAGTVSLPSGLRFVSPCCPRGRSLAPTVALSLCVSVSVPVPLKSCQSCYSCFPVSSSLLAALLAQGNQAQTSEDKTRDCNPCCDCKYTGIVLAGNMTIHPWSYGQGPVRGWRDLRKVEHASRKERGEKGRALLGPVVSWVSRKRRMVPTPVCLFRKTGTLSLAHVPPDAYRWGNLRPKGLALSILKISY